MFEVCFEDGFWFGYVFDSCLSPFLLKTLIGLLCGLRHSIELAEARFQWSRAKRRCACDGQAVEIFLIWGCRHERTLIQMSLESQMNSARNQFYQVCCQSWTILALKCPGPRQNYIIITPADGATLLHDWGTRWDATMNHESIRLAKLCPRLTIFPSQNNSFLYNTQ